LRVVGVAVTTQRVAVKQITAINVDQFRCHADLLLRGDFLGRLLQRSVGSESDH